MSDNNFSSLEKINLLFNNLINSNDNNTAIALKRMIKLVNDLTSLLNDSDYFDIEIRVGIDDNAKVFKAHSNILKARSSYFKAALSNNWVKRSEDGTILFEKENISPKIFGVILTYIYNGVVNTNDLSSDEIIELLVTCDELNFDDLMDDLQNHLITEKVEWVRQNLIYLYKMSTQYQSFNLIREYFQENPDLFLKIENVAEVEKSMLETVLRRDDLESDEIDIWNFVIRWGIAQKEERLLGKEDVSEWDKSDFEELKSVLDDIIPLIRFKQISSSDFYAKVKSYDKVFDKEFYKGLLQYHIGGELQPELPRQMSSRVGKGLLSFKTKYLISSWIDYKEEPYDMNSLPYEFELIFRGSRDGISRAIFQDKCYNVRQTVTLVKIKEIEELVGGYNPVCWNIEGKSPDAKYKIETDKSFIFKIDQNRITDSILSRVLNPKKAICHCGRSYGSYREDGVDFHDYFMDFDDLDIHISVNDEPYCYYYFFSNPVYEKDLKVRNNKKKVDLLEELEVYRLVERKKK